MITGFALLVGIVRGPVSWPKCCSHEEALRWIAACKKASHDKMVMETVPSRGLGFNRNFVRDVSGDCVKRLGTLKGSPIVRLMVI